MMTDFFDKITWADLFKWATSLPEKLEADYVDYYKNYFVESPVCRDLFIVSLLISLVIALFYYFFVCNRSFYLAKRVVWCIVVALVFTATLVVSKTIIVGKDDVDGNKSSGVFLSANLTRDKNTSGDVSQDIITRENDKCRLFKEMFNRDNGEESLPTELSLVNSFYAIIFFFIFSLIFKRYTVHGSAIPF